MTEAVQEQAEYWENYIKNLSSFLTGNIKRTWFSYRITEGGKVKKNLEMERPLSEYDDFQIREEIKRARIALSICKSLLDNNKESLTDSSAA